MVSPLLIQQVADLLGQRVGQHNKLLFSEGIRKTAASLRMPEEKVVACAVGRDPQIYRKLVSTISVNETYFFRHPEHFEVLAQCAARAVIEGNPYRSVWSVGCASGEETYSLAIALQGFSENFHVAGSDISPTALEFARGARYSQWSFRDADPSKLSGFAWKDGRWEVVPWLRERVTFHELNLAGDQILPPPPLPDQVDVIFCRNVLIYLTPQWVDYVIKALAECVREGGLLLLGVLEGPSAIPPGFEALDTPNAYALRRLPRGHVALRPSPPTRAPVQSSAPRPLFSVPRAPSAKTTPAASPKPKLKLPSVLQEARRLADDGNLDAALRLARSMSHDPDAKFLAAFIHFEKGDLQRAELLLREVVIIRPDFIPAHLQLLLLFKRMGDVLGAQRHESSLRRLLEGRAGTDDAGFDGMSIDHVRRILAGLAEEPV